MTHPSHDALWAYASAPKGAPCEVSEHLRACETCAATVADIRVAQEALAALPEVPPLPPAVAQRVGTALIEHADRDALRRWRRWWTELWTPRLLVHAAAAVLLVLVGARLAPSALERLERGPLPRGPTAAPQAPGASPARPLTPVATGREGQAGAPPTTTATAPSPSTGDPASPRPVSRRVKASVALARKASSHATPLERAQTLEEGAQVSTAAGGSLWMRLPDGTRAGLTGATQVTLARLEERALHFDVARGDLAMVVPHREDREVTVRAGDVVVRDLGTRFFVSRNDGRVLVAVEEGAVDVTTPTASRTVRAGRAVSWHDGRLDSIAWDLPPLTPSAQAPVPAPAAAPTAVVTAAGGAGEAAGEGEAERAGDADVKRSANDEDVTRDDEGSGPVAAPTPQTPAAAAGSREDEWASLPPTGDAMAVTPVPPPPFTPPTPPPSRAFIVGELEERLREVRRAFAPPAVRHAERQRLVTKNEVTALANRGECETALELAERWLIQPATHAPEEPAWRRTVMTQKWRCLMRTGRLDEARLVLQVLERQ